MREEYIKEYIDLEHQKDEIVIKQLQLKKLIAKFKIGDIVEINNNSSHYAGKRGKVISINARTVKGDVEIYYNLKRVKKDGTLGENNLGMSYLGFPEDFLNLVSSN